MESPSQLQRPPDRMASRHSRRPMLWATSRSAGALSVWVPIATRCRVDRARAEVGAVEVDSMAGEARSHGGEPIISVVLALRVRGHDGLRDQPTAVHAEALTVSRLLGHGES